MTAVKADLEVVWRWHYSWVWGTTRTDSATWRLAPQVFSLINITWEGVLLYWLSTRVWCGSRHKAAGQLESSCVLNTHFVFNEQLKKKLLKRIETGPGPCHSVFFMPETKLNWQFQADGLCLCCVSCRYYGDSLFNAVTRLVLSAPCKVVSKGTAFYRQYIRSFHNKQDRE